MDHINDHNADLINSASREMFIAVANIFNNYSDLKNSDEWPLHIATCFAAAIARFINSMTVHLDLPNHEVLENFIKLVRDVELIKGKAH